ncbi:serine protease inhibitor Cvsi-2-like [Haliotis rufescens]|uniref:serine protease inhibitor Cvsi-2-like n=1 Tax=Haliotis rufescens TaxID=6454 RepID=UPI001EAFF6E2|nr:serine protease inhibitor Cvsi-2-like [Haliotis rufescens]
MKFLVLGVSVILAFGVVSSERCSGSDASTCSREKCDTNYQLSCVNDECTCLVSACFTGQQSCHAHVDHCNHAAAAVGCRCQHRWHCLDHRCYCGGST